MPYNNLTEFHFLLNKLTPPLYRSYPIRNMALSPQMKAGSQTEPISLQFTLRHHAENVNTLALNPDGDRLLSGGKPDHCC